MSNSATNGTAIGAKIYGATKITPVKVVIDTVDTDLTVYAATSGKTLAIVGWQYSEATAHNMTLTSGTDAQAVLEMPANSGRDDKIGQGVVFATAVGEALKIKSSAAISSMLIYVIETDRLIVQ